MSENHLRKLRRKEQNNTDNETTMFINPEAAGLKKPQSSTPAHESAVPPAQNNTPRPNYGAQPQYNGAPQPNYGAQPQYNGAPQPNYGAQPQYNGAPQPNYGAQPQYNGAPQPNYGVQPQYNGAPQPNYGAQPQYNGAPQPNYGAQPQYNGAPQPNYGAQPQYNGAPQHNYGAQPQYNGAPQPNYGAQPQYNRPPQQPYRPAQPPRPANRPINSAQAPHKRQKPKAAKRKRRGLFSRIFGKLFTTLLTLFIVVFALYSCLSLILIKKMNYVETGARNRTAGTLQSAGVTSVLLLGTDGRSLEDRGRSDTMMLMSINSRKNEITLTSFMRDCYVNIPNYGWDKLNAAYAYGGADLLMDTIESNFNVKIDDYIAVNFLSFAAIVDAVGGIDVDVTDAEAGEINTIMQAEVNAITGHDPMDDLLSGGGKLHLDGRQALSYARIRYIGDADFERTQRQREVLSKIITKAKTFKPSYISGIMSDVVPKVTTNMDTLKLYLLSLRAPIASRYNIEQVRIPAEGTYTPDNAQIGNDWLSVLRVDFETNKQIIAEKVFNK